jgi:hypothetical protein
MHSGKDSSGGLKRAQNLMKEGGRSEVFEALFYWGGKWLFLFDSSL